MPFYQKGDVRIRYEEAGSGFPLLVTPGGGLNSRIGNWPTAVINAMEAFKNDFRCITMDQRNANGGESTGPVPVENPWDAFADDQLGLMDHLGIREFFYMGYCIGGCFAGKLLQRAPGRVVAAVFCQTVGHRPENPTVMYRHSKDNWVPDFMKRRPEVSADTIEKHLHNLYAVQPDFLYSVSRDFIRNCNRPGAQLPQGASAAARRGAIARREAGPPRYHDLMCGRARLSSDVSEIKIAFGVPPERPAPNFAASWNVAPTDPLPVVRYDAKEHQRSLEVMRWGLVPLWAKDIKVGFANINAKAEGIGNKPAFREAFRQRRCLVPVDNFFEWKKVDGGKQPYAIGLKGGGLMALAGLWENWRSPAGERIRSFAIVTTQPNELCAELHNRMPVVLAPEVLASMARRGTGRRGAAQGAARPLPFPRHGVLAGQHARRQREKQRSGSGRADRFALTELRTRVIG